MTASGEGSVRFIFADASETRRDVVFGEVRTEPLDVSTDPQQQLVVPAGSATLEEDDKLIVEMKGDSATTVDNTSVIRIPVRIQNKKTQVVRETYLTGADLGLTSTDVSIATSWTKVGSYTINAQERLRLGHGTRANSTLYAQLAWT
jgi:hypothetical protein